LEEEEQSGERSQDQERHDESVERLAGLLEAMGRQQAHGLQKSLEIMAKMAQQVSASSEQSSRQLDALSRPSSSSKLAASSMR
jgi:hypothetical protein